MEKCFTCGKKTMRTTREDRPYEALPGTVLHQVMVHRCSSCGEDAVEIPALEGLTRALVQVVVEQPGRLQPAEIRFLRKALGWSGEDFAKRFGVAVESVSRWENGKREMPGTTERLLRVLAARLPAMADYADELENVATDEPRPKGYSAKCKGKSWTAKVA